MNVDSHKLYHPEASLKVFYAFLHYVIWCFYFVHLNCFLLQRQIQSISKVTDKNVGFFFFKYTKP